MENLAKLSQDLYFNKDLKFNEVSGNDAMRKLIFEALDVPVGTKGRALKTAWDMRKAKVFEIIDVAIDAIVPVIVKNQFDNLAEVRNVAFGDVGRFTVKNRDLFKVGTVAAGSKDLRRQRLVNEVYTIETDKVGLKTYVEFDEFLSGTIDWTHYVNTVAESLAVYTGEKIYDAFATSYDGVRATLKATGTFELETLTNLARHVRAASGGQNVAVYGTVSALGKIADGLNLSDGMKDKLNETGYLATVRGMEFYAFPDAYKAGTEEFIVDEKALLIIPNGERIVDVVLEGETYTEEKDNESNTSMQKDFLTMKQLGVQVKQASVYGFYKLA